METNLRPMTLGEILDRTAQLYRTNFILFAGISAVYAGVILVMNLLQIGLAELLQALHMTKQLPWFTLAFLALILPLMFIFAGAAVAANNRAVAWVNLGEAATIRGAYQSILPRLGRYLWLMTIATFVIWLPIVLIYGGYFGLIFFYARPRGLFSRTGGGASAAINPQVAIIFGLATLAFVLLLILAVFYAVLMALRYSLAVPASVVENLKARKALRRSIDLSKGSRGRIFILALLVSIIQVGLVAITQVFFIVAAYKQHGVLPAWAQVAQQILGFLTNTFIGPMYATGLTLFYYDQRVRKEGYDIEWMMDAAGLTVPALVAETEAAAAQAEAGLDPFAAPVSDVEPHGNSQQDSRSALEPIANTGTEEVQP